MKKEIIEKEISEFPDYLINSDGKVYSEVSNKFLKPILKNHFMVVTLRKRDKNGNFSDATRQDVRIDLLVANAFLENPTNATYVNHKDGKTFNSKLSNLEWATAAVMQTKKVTTRKFHIFYNMDNGQFKLYNSETKQITIVNNVNEKDERFFSLKNHI